jgi:hypothetical protein
MHIFGQQRVLSQGTRSRILQPAHGDDRRTGNTGSIQILSVYESYVSYQFFIADA